jgi:alanine racemase
MGTGTLQIDLEALAANWRALDAMTGCETAAVVKADGYGLGAARVATRLAKEGVRRFFVAVAEEGATLRKALGEGPEINVFSGHMQGDADVIADARLTPMLNSAEQLARHRDTLPGAPYGIQLDSGMNRLGMEPADWAALRAEAEDGPITLVMSHLACADEPDHPANAAQLKAFGEMTEGVARPPLPRGHRRHPAGPRLPFRPHPPRHRSLWRIAVHRGHTGRAPVPAGDPDARSRTR